jgi:hypothetical protein
LRKAAPRPPKPSASPIGKILGAFTRTECVNCFRS